jgi:HTH-type transcriptional regulator/antitoxin HipB
MTMTIAEQIRDARKAAGLTQQAVADRLGCHVISVNRWERGAQRPDDATLGRLAEVLGVTFSITIGGNNAATRPQSGAGGRG